MKIQKFVAFGVALLLAPLTSTFAQSAWQTVDDFQYAPGKATTPRGVAAGPDGSVFVADTATDASGIGHGLVRRSLDSGATWQTVLDLPGNTTVMAVNVTPWGDVLAVGRIPYYGLVFKSSDGGETWEQVDSFTYTQTIGNYFSVGADPAGQVFVGAGGIAGASNQHWLIRRSLDGGQTWATVDDYSTTGGMGPVTEVRGIATTASAVIAAGRVNNVWTTRRSLDGGTTWITVDRYQLDSKQVSYAFGAAADVSGNFYVVGYAPKTVKRTTRGHWIVRRSTDGGTTWMTVDDYLGNGNGTPTGVAVDAFGRIIVSGYTSSPTRWIVRGSTDAGATWITTDTFSLSATGSANAWGVAGDPLGNIFAVGSADGHAITRILPAP